MTPYSTRKIRVVWSDRAENDFWSLLSKISKRRSSSDMAKLVYWSFVTNCSITSPTCWQEANLIISLKFAPKTLKMSIIVSRQDAVDETPKAFISRYFCMLCAAGPPNCLYANIGVIDKPVHQHMLINYISVLYCIQWLCVALCL